MTVRVLVTGAGALLGQGVIRALKGSSLDFELIAVDPSALAAGLYWSDRAHLVPMANSGEYLPRCRQLLAQERPDVVLVGTDVELPVFSTHREELEGEFGCHVLVSSPGVVAIADDKYATFKFMRDNGFAFPDSVLPGHETELVERVGFPLVVKPRVGARSVGVHIVGSQYELDRALATEEDVVIQEIAGPQDREYTAGSICFDGECKAVVVMRRDLRDGNTYRASVERSAELEGAVRAMGTALRPHGPANFQFRVDAEGRVKVFEINARFSGTTPLRARAGFNEVEMCIRHLVEGTPVVQPEIEELIFLRHWSETVVRPDELIDR